MTDEAEKQARIIRRSLDCLEFSDVVVEVAR